MTRLIVLVLALVLAGCAGRTATVPDAEIFLNPDPLAWKVDSSYFISFSTVLTDTVATPADLPAADTCEGEFYATFEGEDVRLWLAINGTWVQIAPQKEVE